MVKLRGGKPIMIQAYIFYSIIHDNPKKKIIHDKHPMSLNKKFNKIYDKETPRSIMIQ